MSSGDQTVPPSCSACFWKTVSVACSVPGLCSVFSCVDLHLSNEVFRRIFLFPGLNLNLNSLLIPILALRRSKLTGKSGAGKEVSVNIDNYIQVMVLMILWMPLK